MAKTLFLSLDPGAIDAASVERRARLQTGILDSMADAILVMDANGPVYANPAAAKMLGRSFPVGWTLLLGDGQSVIPEADLPTTRASRAEAFEADYCFLKPDGAAMWVSVSGRALVTDGATRGGLLVLRDVTERKEMERQLMLSERMASLGTLAAGVAHEINNPLAFLLGNLDWSLDELRVNAAPSPQERAEIVKALTSSLDGAHRVKKIVAELRTLASGSDELSPVDLVRVVEGALAISAPTVRTRARIVRNFEAAPPALGNESKLGQVILNLLVNAAQAIPEGEASKNEIRVAIKPALDGRIVVEVADTGSGIAPGLLPRIFDPFFTTKAPGVGTGLGLSISHRIITSMGGEIFVTSQPGEGTTFRITLVAATGKTSGATPRGVPASGGRIFVLDDEPGVKDALQRMFRGQYAVEGSANAVDLLERIEKGARFTAILCDVRMPNMNGAEFVTRLRAVAPDQAARVVIVTGDVSAAAEIKGVLKIEKPFDRTALLNAITAVSS